MTIGERVLGALVTLGPEPVTVEAIARQLDANPRDVRRGLDALRLAGVAVHARRTQRGYLWRLSIAARLIMADRTRSTPASPPGRHCRYCGLPARAGVCAGHRDLPRLDPYMWVGAPWAAAPRPGGE